MRLRHKCQQNIGERLKVNLFSGSHVFMQTQTQKIYIRRSLVGTRYDLRLNGRKLFSFAFISERYK